MASDSAGPADSSIVNFITLGRDDGLSILL